jgi:hypothetical protein
VEIADVAFNVEIADVAFNVEIADVAFNVGIDDVKFIEEVDDVIGFGGKAVVKLSEVKSIKKSPKKLFILVNVRLELFLS